MGGSAAGAAGAAGSTGDGGVEAPCNPAEEPAPDGVYVSPSGLDTNAGTAASPVKSLAQAIANAKAAFSTHIYLAVGDYTQDNTLEITEATEGLIIEGGWDKAGPIWTPHCTAGRRSFTTFSVGNAVAIRISETKKATAFRHMTINTKNKGDSFPGATGESMYGIWVAGPTTAAQLLDVEVVAGEAGRGGDTGQPPPSPGSSSCTGHDACCMTEPGCGDPSVGPTAPGKAANGPPANAQGVFAAPGYVAPQVNNGSPGSTGLNGHEGNPGELKASNCRIGGSCGTCQPSCPGNCQGGSPPSGSTPLQGERGRCGCAGLGGVGGAGGRSGGASVALFIVGAATVNVEYSILKAGKGGDGNLGGKGGKGGPGAPGIAGAAMTCNTDCYGGCFGSCGCAIFDTAGGGQAGTLGGFGAEGGDGGGGPGGPSYALVTVSATYVDKGHNQLLFQAGGMGADGAVSGLSGPQWP